MAAIRRAAPCDVPALLGLVESYWRFEGIDGFDPAPVARALEQLLGEAPLGAAWVVEVDREAVGYLLLVYVFSLEHHGLTAEIDELWVHPDHRRRGVGGRLLAAAESDARRVGCANISLQVGRHNHDGAVFYSRHGYGERASYRLLEKSLDRAR